MNRKISLLLVGILSAVAMMGCSKTVDLSQDENYECDDECVVCHVDESEVGHLGENSLYITYNDVALKSSTDPQEVLDSLGEPDDTFSYKFCGTQKDAFEYTYDDGLDFSTYPSDGKYYIESITVSSDKGALSNGVKVGDSRDQVVDTMGESTCYVEDESDYYAYDNAEMTIWYTDGLVSSIYLYYYEP